MYYETLSLQEIFDKVSIHLLTQGKQSKDYHGHCQYRGPGKLKCAAGFLITDEEYNPGMEGKSFNAVSKTSASNGDKMNLIMQLQYIHDVGALPNDKMRSFFVNFPHDLKNALLNLAHEFRLDPIFMLYFNPSKIDQYKDANVQTQSSLHLPHPRPSSLLAPSSLPNILEVA